MTTYVIASKANSPYLAECQIIGEHVAANTPDVSIQVVIKDAAEWPEFIDSVTSCYGFETKPCPIIYTIEGKLIGDQKDFLKHCKDCYGKLPTLTNESKKARGKENQEFNDKKMRKAEGATLGEKVENYLEKLKTKNVSKLIIDSFYQEEYTQGIPLQVKRTNLLRDDPSFKKTDAEQQIKANRFCYVPDEMYIRSVELREAAHEESKKDQTFDNFKEVYGEHMGGKIDPSLRCGGRPETVPWANDGSTIRQPRTNMSKKSEKGGANPLDGFEEKKSTASRNKLLNSIDSKNFKSGIGSQRSQGEESSEDDENARKNQYKYKIPEACNMELLKLNRIETLDEEYYLMVHPYPQMEGELIIVQTNPKDQDDKSMIVYRDYSLRKRIESLPPQRMSAFQKKKQMDMDAEKTKMQCLQIDIETPLSQIDWINFSQVIRETNGLGWIQLLPVGQSSSLPFQFNCMHVLPQSKIPFAKIPLDILIQTKLTYVKKNQKSKRNNTVKSHAVKADNPIHERDDEAFEQNMILIDEFKFPHVVFQLSANEMNQDGLAYAYRKMYGFLGFQTRRDIGITLICTPQWMFLASLEQPYHKENQLDIPGKDMEGGVSVYLDGYAYAGIINIQTIAQTWPATVGIGLKSHQAIEALHLQSTQKVNPPPDTLEDEDADREMEKLGTRSLNQSSIN